VSIEEVQKIQRLLDLGLSMTQADVYGATQFNLAVGRLNSVAPLSTLLGHLKTQSLDNSEITKMEPYALHRVCVRSPNSTGHAFVLLQNGWSPANRKFVAAGPKPGTMSPLYLAIVKKETVLVDVMLKLDDDVVRVSEVHGPISNLLELACSSRVDSPRIEMLLIRAGFYYAGLLDRVRQCAERHTDSALLRWLEEDKEQ
jgi:hypothetical protein